MNNPIFNRASIILVMAIVFIFISNANGQDSGPDNYRDGYGSSGAMGQNPDDLINYGHGMMRYGFHETGMPGGTNKYPGYYYNLSDATKKKLIAEQESFIKETEDLRQTIYEKELYLKAELSKKAPDNAISLSLQKNISEAMGQFEQQMIVHIIRMKNISQEAEKK